MVPSIVFSSLSASIMLIAILPIFILRDTYTMYMYLSSF